MGVRPLPRPLDRMIMAGKATVRYDPYSDDTLVYAKGQEYVVPSLERLFDRQTALVNLAVKMHSDGVTWDEFAPVLKDFSELTAWHSASILQKYHEPPPVVVAKPIVPFDDLPRFRLGPRLRAFRRFTFILLVRLWEDILTQWDIYRELHDTPPTSDTGPG